MKLFDERLGEILSRHFWIIDGNYSRTMEWRMQVCDTVVFFDLPKEVCLDGAISRIGKKRSDMPWIDTTLDPWLKQEIEEFSSKNLPVIYELIEKYRTDKNIVIFKSREESEEFLSRLI